MFIFSFILKSGGFSKSNFFSVGFVRSGGVSQFPARGVRCDAENWLEVTREKKCASISFVSFKVYLKKEMIAVPMGLCNEVV